MSTRLRRALAAGAFALLVALGCSEPGPEPGREPGAEPKAQGQREPGATEAPGASSEGPATETLRLHTRLIDHMHPGVEAALLPTAGIEHDRRGVLRPPVVRDWTTVDFWHDIDPSRSRSVWLPDGVRELEALEARIVATGDGPRLAPLEAPTRSHDGRTLAVRVPPALAGRSGAIQVRPAAPSVSARGPVVVPDVVLPPRAELHVSLGALADSAVDFEIELCHAGACERVFDERVEAGAAWHARTVDLAAWAGRTVELRFGAPTVASDGAAERVPFEEGLFANPTIYQRRVSAERPPSLLLVSLDTLGARHLGTYGARRDTSPFLDDFFERRGLVVDRFISSEVHTGPSHMTLFTGLPPTAHGVHAGTFQRLPYGVETLAGRMRAAGFDTGAVTENAALFVGGGFARGFDTYREERRSGGSLGILATFEAGRAWLEAHADRPFFLFLHTYETHWRFEPPEPWAALFAGDGEADDPRLGEHYALTRYEQEIRFVDDQMRALFDHLEGLGLLEHTVVVVTSDHGEEFLEHGRVGHGAQLHGEVVHVPLLVAGPGVPAGARRAGPMAQVDLAPTLLELLGAPPLRDAMGASVLGWWRGEAEAPARPAFSEAWFASGQTLGGDGKARRMPHAAPTHALTAPGHRLIRKRGGDAARDGGATFELYALDADPAEAKNVAGIAPAATEQLRAQLDAHLVAAAAKRDQLRAREQAILAAGGRIVAPEVDAERLEQLRELGYID